MNRKEAEIAISQLDSKEYYTFFGIWKTNKEIGDLISFFYPIVLFLFYSLFFYKLMMSSTTEINADIVVRTAIIIATIVASLLSIIATIVTSLLSMSVFNIPFHFFVNYTYKEKYNKIKRKYYLNDILIMNAKHKWENPKEYLILDIDEDNGYFQLIEKSTNIVRVVKISDFELEGIGLKT